MPVTGFDVFKEVVSNIPEYRGLPDEKLRVIYARVPRESTREVSGQLEYEAEAILRNNDVFSSSSPLSPKPRCTIKLSIKPLQTTDAPKISVPAPKISVPVPKLSVPVPKLSVTAPKADVPKLSVAVPKIPLRIQVKDGQA